MTNVLLSTAHGPLIVNTNDFNPDLRFGVGAQLFATGRYDPILVGNITELLKIIRSYRHRPIVVLDVGANIGVMTVEWARAMMGGEDGTVIAVEPQRRVFQMLCGNVALNNCPNVLCLPYALSDFNGFLATMMPDYARPGSFGSLSLTGGLNDMGQELFADRNELVEFVSMDRLFNDDERQLCGGLVDFVKIDAEGMEHAVLQGGMLTLARERPVLFVEHGKTPVDEIQGDIYRIGEYETLVLAHDVVAVSKRDELLWDHIRQWRWE